MFASRQPFERSLREPVFVVLDFGLLKGVEHLDGWLVDAKVGMVFHLRSDYVGL